jgi:hypothetical protein
MQQPMTAMQHPIPICCHPANDAPIRQPLEATQHLK